MLHHKITLLILVGVLLLSDDLVVRNASATSTTVVVNESSDLSDNNPGDGQCDTLVNTPGNQCGLRAAIEELNALGAQTLAHRITFDIPSPEPHTIKPEAPLPEIRGRSPSTV